jgi:hypothetical protein
LSRGLGFVYKRQRQEADTRTVRKAQAFEEAEQ